MCNREITSYKSPLQQRKQFEELRLAGTPPCTPPEAPKPATPLPPCHARLQGLMRRPDLNGVEVEVEGVSGVPGRIAVRMPVAGDPRGYRRLLVKSPCLQPNNGSASAPTLTLGGDAVVKGRLPGNKPIQEILEVENHVNRMKRAARISLEVGPKAVISGKGLRALYEVPSSGEKTPSVFSARSASSLLPPRDAALPPFPDSLRSPPQRPAPPGVPLGAARVPLREESKVPLSARRGRKGYIRNAHGGFWGKLT